ncbi:MAG: hypothetical protein KatS3mg102_1723 [Planctomycetota bacterium]|nr:MAG: hypothetical protein KatS3mg102_1723 [Planctomycetota bacterium]
MRGQLGEGTPGTAPDAREIARAGGCWRAPRDGAVMVLVPAGEVFIGREPGDLFAPEDELPGRVVWLSAYLIDRDPVSNAQFAQFIADGGYTRPELWREDGWAWRSATGVTRPLSFLTVGFDGERQPAAGLSWYEADAYARWAGKQLPTEAQWEKAARGTDRRRFPWGEALPRSQLCNFDGRLGRTSELGRYPEGRSPYGLTDMAGNVNNWCRDWYWEGFYRWCVQAGLDVDPCLDDALRARLGLDLRQRSDRGGGYATSFACWDVLTTSGRLGWPPASRHLWHGLRCVIELR